MWGKKNIFFKWKHFTFRRKKTHWQTREEKKMWKLLTLNDCVTDGLCIMPFKNTNSVSSMPFFPFVSEYWNASETLRKNNNKKLKHTHIPKKCCRFSVISENTTKFTQINCHLRLKLRDCFENISLKTNENVSVLRRDLRNKMIVWIFYEPIFVFFFVHFECVIRII